MRSFATRPNELDTRVPVQLQKSQEGAVDAATRNRYRLRFREAVPDPSAPRALLASVGMTDMLALLAAVG